ncbi:BLUF domain-containing protein [Flavobacterium sp.]|uniref:BLUF domain-containing protein n=1 Tax=Flavobacterium sp. TaxID=239 RepID=UPI00286E366F|nr:BLUF domain-containing protein [Flavobacterium sp.]
MYEIIYRSVAKPNISADDIAKILETARNFNSENEITGCLLFHNNEFIQIIEGEKSTLLNLYESIKKDKRHGNVMLLAEAEIQNRIFPNWSMAYYQLNENDSVNIDKLLFVNNFITLSELIEKPTHASRLFWLMAKQLLER